MIAGAMPKSLGQVYPAISSRPNTKTAVGSLPQTDAIKSILARWRPGMASVTPKIPNGYRGLDMGLLPRHGPPPGVLAPGPRLSPPQFDPTGGYVSPPPPSASGPPGMYASPGLASALASPPPPPMGGPMFAPQSQDYISGTDYLGQSLAQGGGVPQGFTMTPQGIMPTWQALLNGYR